MFQVLVSVLHTFLRKQKDLTYLIRSKKISLKTEFKFPVLGFFTLLQDPHDTFNAEIYGDVRLITKNYHIAKYIAFKKTVDN